MATTIAGGLYRAADGTYVDANGMPIGSPPVAESQPAAISGDTGDEFGRPVGAPVSESTVAVPKALTRRRR